MIVPKELRALMSAVLLEEKPLDNGFTSYKFEQKMRIPVIIIEIYIIYSNIFKFHKSNIYILI